MTQLCGEDADWAPSMLCFLSLLCFLGPQGSGILFHQKLAMPNNTPAATGHREFYPGGREEGKEDPVARWEQLGLCPFLGAGGDPSPVFLPTPTPRGLKGILGPGTGFNLTATLPSETPLGQEQALCTKAGRIQGLVPR